jgi:hypothetical protein
MTVIPFGPRAAPTTTPIRREPDSHREMDAWPRPAIAITPTPRPRPSLTLVR